MTTTDMQVLDSLSNADREVAVTEMLDQARQWLEKAKQSTTPAQDVAQFKAFVATVVEAAKQKKLSAEIQLDAVEMLRRSERALGVAIREGQAAGEIESLDAARSRAGQVGRGTYQKADGILMPKPVDFASASELSNSKGGIWDLTDGVTDEEFEQVVSDAKAEKNLSRANVVRKVLEIGSFREQQEEKWQTVTEMAADGYSSQEISREVEMSEEGLRAAARKKGIVFKADAAIGGTRRLNSLRTLEGVVMAIEVSESSIKQSNLSQVTPEMANDWATRLAQPLRELNKLQKQLKEIGNV